MTNQTLQNRKTKLVLIIGYNGTGKSTFVQKIIDNATKRVLICTPHDVEWLQYDLIKSNKELVYFEGVKRIIVFDKNDLENVFKYYRGGLIVFDDCRVYFGSYTDPIIRKLLIERRQKMLDIVAVGHGFTEIPPSFFTFASELVLFRTKDNILRRKGVLNDFEALQKQQNEINEIATKEPYFYRIIKF